MTKHPFIHGKIHSVDIQIAFPRVQSSVKTFEVKLLTVKCGLLYSRWEQGG